MHFERKLDGMYRYGRFYELWSECSCEARRESVACNDFRRIYETALRYEREGVVGLCVVLSQQPAYYALA